MLMWVPTLVNFRVFLGATILTSTSDDFQTLAVLNVNLPGPSSGTIVGYGHTVTSSWVAKWSENKIVIELKYLFVEGQQICKLGSC